jgi:hypothetical protein
MYGFEVEKPFGSKGKWLTSSNSRPLLSYSVLPVFLISAAPTPTGMGMYSHYNADLSNVVQESLPGCLVPNQDA